MSPCHIPLTPAKQASRGLYTRGRSKAGASRGVAAVGGQDVARKLNLGLMVLEAFGNASTATSPNSSRFGSYTQLFYDSSGALRSAAIST